MTRYQLETIEAACEPIGTGNSANKDQDLVSMSKQNMSLMNHNELSGSAQS